MTKPNGKPFESSAPGVSPSPQINRVRTLESLGRVPSSPSLNINRIAYNVSQFNEDFTPIPTTKSEKISKFKPDFSRKTWIRRLRGLFPISIWLPEYNFRENILADIMVGITIAIFQVPQSMGYCLIAHVPPVYGLYSSFFPALFYTILGTGMHCAFGPFAIVSGVMTGDIVLQVMKELGKTPDNTMRTLPSTLIEDSGEFAGLKNIDIAIMVAFIIGAYILAFGVFQFGFISNFMSEELISGFTTSACVIVFVSQLRYLLGVDLGHFSGPFNLYYTLEDVFTRLDEVNMTTLKISGICLSILLVFKLVVNRFTHKYIATPFPIELCVVICGTIASYFMGLKDKPYNVVIVDTIGDKFPVPVSPNFALFPYMWNKCIAVAIVGYTITFSVCKIYGKKHDYKTDSNQEMIAMGATNVAVSFFQCIPAAASLPRSALQETAGGKTQVVSIVNCCCIVVVILALGKYLEELPVCVLGSCIAVALVSLITKMAELRRFWKVSKLDGMIWIITFVAVLVISVDWGIYLGLICSLLLLIYKSGRPKTYLLGTIDDMDIYVPLNKFNMVFEPSSFKIFQFCGPLNFSNIEYFCTSLENKCELNLTQLKKYIKTKEFELKVEKLAKTSYEPIPKLELIRMALNERLLIKYLIIDCSMFSFIDYSGITTLKKTVAAFEAIGIKTVLSGIQVHLESMLAKEGFFDDISPDLLYKSVHDAVVCLQEFDSQAKDKNSAIDNVDDGLYMKDITTQMNSKRNTFKNELNNTSKESKSNTKNEELTKYSNKPKIQIPRIYALSQPESTPPMPRKTNQQSTPPMRRKQTPPALRRATPPLTRKLTPPPSKNLTPPPIEKCTPPLARMTRKPLSPLALHSLQSQSSPFVATKPDSAVVEVERAGDRQQSYLYRERPEQPISPAIDFELNSPSTPSSDTTEILSLSPQVFPNEPYSPYSSYSPAPTPQPSNPYFDNIPKPPPPPPAPVKSPIPVPPPMPPQSFFKNNNLTKDNLKSKAKPNVNTSQASKIRSKSRTDEPKEDYDDDANLNQVSSQKPSKVSAALKSRSDMVQRMLESHRNSDA